MGGRSIQRRIPRRKRGRYGENLALLKKSFWKILEGITGRADIVPGPATPSGASGAVHSQRQASSAQLSIPGPPQIVPSVTTIRLIPLAFKFVLIFIVLFLFGSRFEPQESNPLLLTVLFRFADVSSFHICLGPHGPAPFLKCDPTDGRSRGIVRQDN